MQIQFAVNQASASSIQQLATNFLLTEPKDQNERIKLVNSLLITMSKTNKPLQKIFEVIVQIRQQQKQSKIGGLIKQNGCKLLEQIVTKYKPIMKQQQLDRNNLSEIKGERIVEKVIKYCCEGAISGLKPNQYINIIYQLHNKAKDVDEIKSLANKVILNNLLLNPKIHVSSFSQSSRHKLYNLLLSSVEELPIDLENSNNKKGENSQENSTKLTPNRVRSILH